MALSQQQNGSLVVSLTDEGGEGTSPRKEITWNGVLPAGSAGDPGGGAKKKHCTLKGAGTAAKFVARLSPKSVRRKAEIKTALMKVR